MFLGFPCVSTGNKSLSLLPVALSLSVSYVSGMAMLGMPAEIYFFGIHYILQFVGTSIGAIIAAYTFLPVMYQTQTSSVNMVGKTLMVFLPISSAEGRVTIATRATTLLALLLTI